MKKLILFLLSGICYLSAFALRVESGSNVVISQPVQEDLYITGGTIIINAPVYGDLVIAGGRITINDSVTNDITVVGGTATFNGFVGDDIRCGGGNLRISNNVAGDVILAGGSVVIDSGISVGNLLAGSGNITMNGTVNGELKSFSGELILNGNIVKDMDCRGGKITVNGAVGGTASIAAPEIIIQNKAVFNNGVHYWSKQPNVDFGKSIKHGSAIYDTSLQMNTGQWYYLGSATLFGLLWYLGMVLLMIFLVQYLFAALMKRAADTAFSNTLKSLGFGFLFFIAVPVAAVIAFITLVGIPVGLLLVMSYIIVVLLATIITSVVIANWINNRFDKNWSFRQITFAAFGIFIGLKLIYTAPVVGWMVMSLLVLTAFGSIFLNIIRKASQTAAPMVPA